MAKTTLEKIQIITRVLNEHNIQHQERKETVGCALTLMAAYSAPIPSSPVEQVYDYYNNTVKPAISDIVAAVNEVFVVDAMEVMENAWNVWKARYKLVHEPFDRGVMDWSRLYVTGGTALKHPVCIRDIVEAIK